MTDLKTIRKAFNWSLAYVGKYCEVSKQYVHDIEKGNRPMSDKFETKFKEMVEYHKKIVKSIK